MLKQWCYLNVEAVKVRYQPVICRAWTRTSCHFNNPARYSGLLSEHFAWGKMPPLKLHDMSPPARRLGRWEKHIFEWKYSPEGRFLWKGESCSNYSWQLSSGRRALSHRLCCTRPINVRQRSQESVHASAPKTGHILVLQFTLLYKALSPHHRHQTRLCYLHLCR